MKSTLSLLCLAAVSFVNAGDARADTICSARLGYGDNLVSRLMVIGNKATLYIGHVAGNRPAETYKLNELTKMGEATIGSFEKPFEVPTNGPNHVVYYFYGSTDSRTVKADARGDSVNWPDVKFSCKFPVSE